MPSEKLASAENLLKGNLASAWNILEGSSGDYTDLGIARRFGGASAAYSLRDIGAMNGSVVRVRREPEDTTSAIDDEENFSANQVQSGALEDWVNGKLESKLPADVATAAAAYSLRKVKEDYSDDAVRIRRSSDGIEVDVAFDSDGKVSASSPITDGGTELTPSPDADLGSTTATTLNEFLNEDVNVETSDFSSDVDGYSSAVVGHSTLTRESSFEGESDVLKVVKNTGRNGIRKVSVDIDNENSYTITFKYYAESSLNNLFLNFGYSFANQLSPSNYFQITSGSWQTATLTMNSGFTSNSSSLQLRVSAATSGTEGKYGTTIAGTIYYKDIVVTATDSGGFVHTWYDQAGSNDATQSTAANQPKIAEGGALLADGIDFDGSNDELETGANITGSTINGFVVANLDGTDGKSLYSVGNTKPNVLFGDPSLAYAINGGISLSGGTAPTLKDTLFTSLFISGGTSKGFINALEVFSGSAGSNSASSDKLTIGNLESGDRFMNGSMKELILYTSDQSDNRFKIESNINNYYGLYNDANEMAEPWTSPDASVTNESKDGFTVTNPASGDYVAFELAIPAPHLVPSRIRVSFMADDPDDALNNISCRTSANGSSGSTLTINNGFNSIDINNNVGVGNTTTHLNIQFNAGTKTATLSNFKVSRIARNGFVETWYDQSGNGNDATQISATIQPVIVSNGGLANLNNKTPAVGFERNGSADRRMELSSEITGEPYTFITVGVARGTQPIHILRENATLTSTANRPQINIGKTSMVYASDPSTTSGAITVDGDNDFIASFLSSTNGGTADMRFNKSSVHTFTRGAAGNGIGFLGKFDNTSTPLTMVESWIVYESDLSSDIEEVENEITRPIEL